ncbi:hypothetical protein D3C80_1418950 [compost metagenome]
MAAMVSIRDTMPIFTALTARSEKAASICATMVATEISSTAVTPLVFWAVMAVMTLAA